MFKKDFYIIFISIFLSSCLKVEKYSHIPEIHFTGYQVYEFRDTANLNNLYLRCELHFDFHDGDGNIGTFYSDNDGNNFILREIDTTYKYKKDIYLTRYNKIHGKYVLHESDTTFGDKYLPFIEKKGQNKTIIGEIKVNVDILTILLKHDTIRFEYFIVDRDDNKSNVDFTPDIALKIEQ